MKYTLQFDGPVDSAGNPIVNSWFIRGDNVLDWYEISVRREGRTVFQVLNELIDRRRFAGWYLTLEDNGNALLDGVINVFSFNDTVINLPTANIPANANVTTANLVGVHDITGPTVTANQSHSYHSVVAVGEFMRTVFSGRIGKESVNPDTLFRPAWTAARETEYLDGAGTGEDADANTDFRNGEKFSDVFRRFVIRADWNLKTREALGTNQFWIAPNRDSIGGMTTDAAVAGVYAANNPQPGVTPWGKTLQSSLPRKTDSGDFQRSFVLICTDHDFDPANDDPENQCYEYSDKLSTENAKRVCGREWSAGVSVLHTSGGDEGPGPGVDLRVEGAVRHVLAKYEWENESPNATHPNDDPSDEGLTYLGAWITTAIETDDKIGFEFRLANAIGKNQRILTIPVPNARLDIQLPGTVIGLTDKKKLDVETDGKILRDDRARLEAIATAAGTWYSTTRQAVRVGWQSLDTRGLALGQLITTINTAGTTEVVNSVVTQFTFSFANGTTQVQTQFAELDPGVLTNAR